MNGLKDKSTSSIIFEQRDPISSVIRLKSGKEILGLLHPCNNNLRTVVETTEGLWYLTYNRYIQPRISVRSETLDIVASYEGHQNKTGKLIFSNGNLFYWECYDSEESIWGFSTYDDHRIISYKITKITPQIKGIVMIENQGDEIQEMNLLTLIGCYMMLMINDDIAGFLPSVDW
jgi:hypothetical protein